MEYKNSSFINWLKSLDPNGEGIHNIGGRQWIEPDLNLKTDNFFPLNYMSYPGVSGVVQLLWNKDTDLYNLDRTLNNPLSAATHEGHETVVLQLLLEKGANVNAKHGDYGSALSAASFKVTRK